MSHYGCINSRVFFTKYLQQYVVYKDFHQLYLSFAEALVRLKTMGILDLMITLPQMLEWTQSLAGIKDHSIMPAKITNAYNADYKKRCVIKGANVIHSKQLKWFENQLVNLNVDAKNEALHKRVTGLVIKIDVIKADKIALEKQTAEQCVAADALKKEEHDTELERR